MPGCGSILCPLVIESLGGWSDLAVKTLSSIGRFLGQWLGILPSDSVRHLFQRCAISLWMGNASLWLHRYPTISPHIDSIINFDFYKFFCCIFCFVTVSCVRYVFFFVFCIVLYSSFSCVLFFLYHVFFLLFFFVLFIYFIYFFIYRFIVIVLYCYAYFISI